MLKKLMAKLNPPPGPAPQGILAVYTYLDHFCQAIEHLRSTQEVESYETYTPTSYHEVEHSSGFGYSPVRWFTLVCGLTGTITGFALCMLIDLDWPLVTGGKTPGIYSLPAFIVIGFEMTILFGGIGTIVGMLVMCKIPNPKTTILDNRLTDDRFGIFVPNVGPNSSQAKLLKELGAQEICEIGGT